MRALMRPTQWRYITYVLGHSRYDHERPLEPEVVLFHEATPVNEEGATLVSLEGALMLNRLRALFQSPNRPL